MLRRGASSGHGWFARVGAHRRVGGLRRCPAIFGATVRALALARCRQGAPRMICSSAGFFIRWPSTWAPYDDAPCASAFSQPMGAPCPLPAAASLRRPFDFASCRDRWPGSTNGISVTMPTAGLPAEWRGCACMSLPSPAHRHQESPARPPIRTHARLGTLGYIYSAICPRRTRR